MEFPMSLNNLLPPLNITEDSFEAANALLTNADERLRYAQFWYVERTETDSTALALLQDGNVNGAISVWAADDARSSRQNLMVTQFIVGRTDEAIKTAVGLYNRKSAGRKLSELFGLERGHLTNDEILHSFLDALTEDFYLGDTALPDSWRAYVSVTTADSLQTNLRIVTSSHNMEGMLERYAYSPPEELWTEVWQMIQEAEPIVDMMVEVNGKTAYSEPEVQSLADFLCEMLNYSIDCIVYVDNEEYDKTLIAIADFMLKLRQEEKSYSELYARLLKELADNRTKYSRSQTADNDWASSSEGCGCSTFGVIMGIIAILKLVALCSKM